MPTSAGPDIIEDGLVLHLDAADRQSYPGAGTVWKDLSGGGNDGTLTNGPTFDSGNGGSIVFDGVDDIVLTNNTIDLSFKSFTLISWCNLIPTGQRYVLGGGTATSNQGLHFGYRETNLFTIDLFANSITLFKNRLTNVEMLVGIYEYDEANNNGILKLYSNGGYIGQGTQKSPFESSIQVEIGRVPLSGTRNYGSGGNIYQTSIYNRALTPTEILQNFNATKSRFNL